MCWGRRQGGGGGIRDRPASESMEARCAVTQGKAACSPGALKERVGAHAAAMTVCRRASNNLPWAERAGCREGLLPIPREGGNQELKFSGWREACRTQLPTTTTKSLRMEERAASNRLLLAWAVDDGMPRAVLKTRHSCTRFSIGPLE